MSGCDPCRDCPLSLPWLDIGIRGWTHIHDMGVSNKDTTGRGHMIDKRFISRNHSDILIEREIHSFLNKVYYHWFVFSIAPHG